MARGCSASGWHGPPRSITLALRGIHHGRAGGGVGARVSTSESNAMKTFDASPMVVVRSGTAASPSPWARDVWGWAARGAVLTGILLFVAPWSPPAPAVLSSSLARAAPTAFGPLVEPIAQVLLATAWRLGLVALSGAAIPRATRGVPVSAWRQAWVVAVLCALATVLRWPSALGVQTLPITIGVGIWAWWSARLVGRSLVWGLAWLAATGLVGAVGLAVFTRALTDTAPRVTNPPGITREDRARLEQMLRLAGDHLDENIELRLSAADLNGIAAAWLASRSTSTRARFAGTADSLRCELTQPIHRGAPPSFLNVDMELQPLVSADRTHVGLTALRVGRVRLPGVVVAHLSSAVGGFVGRSPRAARLLDAISELTFSAGALRIVADPDRASSALASSMAASPAASDRLRADVRDIMQVLVDECSSLPAGDERFFGLLRRAFEVAERGSTGRDAADLNRAALVALAIQVGDPRVRRLAGFPASEAMTTFAPSFDQQTTLHGRNDLARHFLVSAALRALSTRDIGMTMGLLKEKLDAVDGGSGFSFTDIAADMAGLRFADNLLDPARAAGMQRRIRDESSVETLLPSLAGLSDGLSEAVFKRLYGSLTDDRYRRVILVIENRMEASALLASGRATGRN